MNNIILYVDALSKDDCLGQTTNPEFIAHNNAMIDPKTVEKITDTLLNNNEITTIGSIGRYLFISSINLNTCYYNMTFVDFLKDEQRAIRMSEALAGGSFEREVMEVFYSLLKIYDEVYEYATLEVGKANFKYN